MTLTLTLQDRGQQLISNVFFCPLVRIRKFLLEELIVYENSEGISLRCPRIKNSLSCITAGCKQ